MSEEGTIISGDNAGGLINAAAPTPVSYDASAVSGRMPRQGEAVCFVRDPNQKALATSVRVGACVSANLAHSFEATFNGHAGGLALGDAARAEVARLADQRAMRVLKPAEGATSVPNELLAARIALAHAAMLLLAVEIRTLKGDISPEALRLVLRRQRPTLPR